MGSGRVFPCLSHALAHDSPQNPENATFSSDFTARGPMRWEEGHAGFPRPCVHRGTSHPTLSACAGWRRVAGGRVCADRARHRACGLGSTSSGLPLDPALQGNRTSLAGP